VKKRIMVGSAAGAVLLGIILATTVGGAFARTTGATPLPPSSCSAIQNPDGNLLIASDLPEQSSGRSQIVQMEKAIPFIFAQDGWKAGNYTLAYQACDDSTVQAGKWDSDKCSANANAYAQDASVVGVIGTFNSGCAEIEIPVLNRAAAGPLGMISPANTYVGLTHAGPGTSAGEPQKYYPTGTRNYARVVAADDFQGAADATLAKQLKVKKVFILNDKEAYGLGVATNFKNAAVKLGIKVVGFTAWDPKATSYQALAVKIKASGATGVFLGGLICDNGGKLIRDLKAGVPAAKLMAPDGFTPLSSVFKLSQGKALGMTVSVAGLPNAQLPVAGKDFVAAFGKTIGGVNPDPYASYAAQAAQMFVAAIAASDGTRASVAAEMFKVNVANGILGNVSFNANGDVTANPVTIYKVTSVAKLSNSSTYKVIVPSNKLVAAA
jgi:branched-chain amino acid transport system substrate-binding protein